MITCSQSKIFPPKGLRNKGKHQTTYTTVNGHIIISRTVYRDKDTGTVVVPYDKLLGIEDDRYSPGVREMCCREVCCCSFSSSSNNLHRLAQLDISSTTISQISYRQGNKIALQQSHGDVKADFTCKDCLDNTIIVGADGVMVPLVTDTQKRNRRNTEATCGAFTRRLKGPRMKWDTDNAQRMMNIETIHFSGQWDKYWEKERAA